MDTLRRWARKTARVLAVAMLVGGIVQFYAAGLLVYGRPTTHALTGWGMLLTGLLILIASAVGHGLTRRTGVALLLAASLMLQPVFVFVLVNTSVFLGALHPLNGLAIVGLSAWLVWDRPAADS